MKFHTPLKIVILFALFPAMLKAADTVPVPPLLTAPESAAQGVLPGDWKADSALLDYAETEQTARRMEEAEKFAEALILWERILDRTTCTEQDREKARGRIKELRTKVQNNFDKDQARKWNVLVLVYKEATWDQKAEDGTVTSSRRVFSESDYKQIGLSLGGFRDLVFTGSSGIVLLDFDFVFVEKPIIYSGQGFPVSPRDALPEFKKVADHKKYDTVMAYVKFRGGDGPNLPRPWTAAVYGRVGELDNAAFMMVPWGPDYPYRGEKNGEMELHEWLHQIDDIVHQNLGYPRGTTRSSDDGRTVDDSRKDGEQEYKRPNNVTTWVHFYEHLMTEHMTRQIWSEITTNPNGSKPGKVISIL